MNVVVGATGTLGAEICRLLAGRGEPVRALVRTSSDAAKVAALEGLGCEIVVGDLKAPGSLEALCAGATAVYSTASALLSQQPDDSFEAVDRDGQKSLVDAAVAAGVARFVFVSVLDLAPDFAFAAAKAEVARHLAESSLDYTILQCSCFMDSWLNPHVGFDYAGGAASIYGDGTSAMGWIHSADVAAIAVATASEPAARRAVIGVVGPERLTPLEIVRIFEELSGRTFGVERVPVAALRAQFDAAAHPVEKAFAGLMLRYAAGEGEVAPPPFVRERATRTVAAYARHLLGADAGGAWS